MYNIDINTLKRSSINKKYNTKRHNLKRVELYNLLGVWLREYKIYQTYDKQICTKKNHLFFYVYI